MESSNLVFPWSTCPITTMTGGRDCKSSGFSESKMSFNFFSSLVFSSASVSAKSWISKLRSAPIITAVSKSIFSLIEVKTPFLISSCNKRLTGICDISAKARTVMTGGIKIVFFSFGKIASSCFLARSTAFLCSH